MIRRALYAAGTILGDMLESWGTQYSRQELVQRCRELSDRVVELEDELDELLEGATIDPDEAVEHTEPPQGFVLTEDHRAALRTAMFYPEPYSQSEDTDRWVRQMLQDILIRSSHDWGSPP